MKSHISATIDQKLLERVDRYRKAVRRSRSQVIELAVERLLETDFRESEDVVISEGRFTGKFDRAETYHR